MIVMNKRPKILYLQFAAKQSKQLQEIINDLASEYECITVHTREDYVFSLHEFKPDLVMAEEGIMAVSSKGALKLVQNLSDEIPFILVTESSREDDALSLLEAGAADYILKEKAWRLPFVLSNQLGKIRATKIMEHALLEKSRLYEQNLAGVFSASIQGNIRSCNPALATILGYDCPENLVGKEIGAMYLLKEEHHETLQLLLENGSVKNYESTLIRRDGKHVRLLINSYLLYDSILGEEICEGVIIDYTDTAEILINLDQINAQLIKRNKNLEQFTYVISHNLRAPLSNIISLTELLKDSNTGLQTTELINGLNTSIKTMDGIIKDLNHTLQVKDHLNIKKEEVCFQQLMDEIAFSINNLVMEEEVKINYDFEVPALRTIRGYLYSIFYNLTLNSIKYRRPEETPVIKVRSVVEEERLLLTFEDNGKGIDLEKNGENLFGLYQRFDPTIEGKGMGLFMVKTQIEDLHGSIDVESQVGKGTRISIRLPLEAV